MGLLIFFIVVLIVGIVITIIGFNFDLEGLHIPGVLLIIIMGMALLISIPIYIMDASRINLYNSKHGTNYSVDEVFYGLVDLEK